MEPERNIEKLLRTCAQLRRAAAGDAFTLHPFTRRRLQAAVDKQFAASPAKKPLSRWRWFRRQWALLAAFALVFCFVATRFLPDLNHAKMKSQSVTAMANPRPINAPSTLAEADKDAAQPATLDGAAKDRLLSKNSLTTSARGKAFVSAADKKISGDFSGSTAPADAPMERKALAPAASATLTHAGAGKLALDQPLPAATPNATTTTAGNLTLNGTSTDSGAVMPAAAKQYFKAADRNKSEALDGKNISQIFRNAAHAAPVLASFAWQQNGDSLAIVDADGSIYQGSLQTNYPVSQTQVAAIAAPRAALEQLSNAAQNQVATANAFYFRVAGQNRTTKQNVVFVGNLVSLSNGAANVQVAAPVNSVGGRWEMSPAQNAAVLSNSRIAGTATVDVTNQIEVNATPVMP